MTKADLIAALSKPEVVARVADAIENASVERVIEYQQFQLKENGDVFGLREQIAFRKTSTTQAKAALSEIKKLLPDDGEEDRLKHLLRRAIGLVERGQMSTADHDSRVVVLREAYSAVYEIEPPTPPQKLPDDGWRPIATAPKYKRVLCTFDFNGVYCAEFDSVSWFDGSWEVPTPTHWMPLPTPPQKLLKEEV